MTIKKGDAGRPAAADLERIDAYWRAANYGLFNCYEAFIHIVDSMFNQHAKWLESSDKIPWRRPVASLNYLLSSHVWRQDHLRVRVVNVVDLMRLQPSTEHPHGMTDAEFDALFTRNRPIVFAFHGYPGLIRRLTYRRTNHGSLHVRGYKEEGTTTTPFDMVMLNDLDRFHLVIDVIDRVPRLGQRAAHLRAQMQKARLEARAYTREHGEDDPGIAGWTWPN